MFTAADFTIPVSQDSPRACPRCKGEGMLRDFMHVNWGVCYSCSGDGEVPSVADERRSRAFWARVSPLHAAVLARLEVRREAMVSEGVRCGVSWDFYEAVSRGYHQVGQDEPHRMPALWASVANGRVDAVIDALAAYMAPVPAG